MEEKKDFQGEEVQSFIGHPSVCTIGCQCECDNFPRAPHLGALLLGILQHLCFGRVKIHFSGNEISVYTTTFRFVEIPQIKSCRSS